MTDKFPPIGHRYMVYFSVSRVELSLPQIRRSIWTQLDSV
jgi:hypothetical protein